MPVPVIVTDCAPSSESFGNVNVAERAPAPPGVNVKSIVHEPPAGMTGGPPWHVSDGPTKAKSPGLRPLAVGGPVRCAGSEPLLENVSVNVFEPLVRTL